MLAVAKGYSPCDQRNMSKEKSNRNEEHPVQPLLVIDCTQNNRRFQDGAAPGLKPGKCRITKWVWPAGQVVEDRC
ncbi:MULTISPECIES: hypothetical protein [Rhizobium]|uniref:hypothetical protein n=1 Tax=Rhizobium TaxID=379 RepID=UPI0012FECEE7|nr:MULTISPECIES: hypothetical protein [Rhizobium]NEI94591.1 hypothetical protein [Rhizobium leguminosarum]NEJ78794.1 hypothetical protein [Rhizobium leguminosarum]